MKGRAGRLDYVVGFLELSVDGSAEESRELDVAFGAVCGRVDGSIRVGPVAFDAGELGLESSKPTLVFGDLLFGGIVLWFGSL